MLLRLCSDMNSLMLVSKRSSTERIVIATPRATAESPPPLPMEVSVDEDIEEIFRPVAEFPESRLNIPSSSLHNNSVPGLYVGNVGRLRRNGASLHSIHLTCPLEELSHDENFCVNFDEFMDITFGTPLSERERSNSTVQPETSYCQTSGLRTETFEMRFDLDIAASPRFSDFGILLTGTSRWRLTLDLPWFHLRDLMAQMRMYMVFVFYKNSGTNHLSRQPAEQPYSCKTIRVRRCIQFPINE
jgi:hypothetical protein